MLLSGCRYCKEVVWLYRDLLTVPTLLELQKMMGWCGRVEPLMKYSLNSGHPFNEGSAYCLSYIEMCTKLPLKYGHLSNEGSAYCFSYIDMCTKRPLKYGHLSNEDSAYCPSYKEMCT